MTSPPPAMNDKPCFDVAVVGLDPERARLIGVVFRHIRYNRFAFRLAAPPLDLRAQILVADIGDPAGAEAFERAQACRPPQPAVAVVPDGAVARGRHAVEASQLLRQLLPALNRLVEIEDLVRSPRAAPAGPDADIAPPDAPHGQPSGADTTPPVAVAGAIAPCAPAAGAQSSTAAGAQSSPPAGAQTAPRGGGRPCVLVVEDSATVRAQLSDAFERMGLAVDVATTAGEALARLEAGHVDLAMLDLGLPDIDGLQLARRIRGEPRWRALPIVALSSRTSALDIVRGAAAGCDAYLGKPVGFGDLRRTVAGQLRRVIDADALPPELLSAPA